MNFIQSTLQLVEVGRAQVVVRIIPLITTLIVVAGAFDFMAYHGLNDPQSMDNAQLARQIVRHQGFTTKFLRPQAVAQLHDYRRAVERATGKPRRSVPAEPVSPPGRRESCPTPTMRRAIPACSRPGFIVTHPDFEQVPSAIGTAHMYSRRPLDSAAQPDLHDPDRHAGLWPGTSPVRRPGRLDGPVAFLATDLSGIIR